ncbi:MAG: hypothetical protein JXB88_21085 [Spirochaetales bacterium]|nr:hypothetical protein [Spirochaetales bacterium]
MKSSLPGKFYFTVGQLIEILSALPQDVPVLVSGCKSGYENFFHPELVTLKHRPDNWYTDGEFQVAEEGGEG